MMRAELWFIQRGGGGAPWRHVEKEVDPDCCAPYGYNHFVYTCHIGRDCVVQLIVA